MSLASWKNDVKMSSTKRMKRRAAILRRIDFYRKPRYLQPNMGLLHAVLRLEWENEILRETLQQKKIDVEKLYNAHKYSTFLKALSRTIKEYFKEEEHWEPESKLDRLKNKIFGEDG